MTHGLRDRSVARGRDGGGSQNRFSALFGLVDSSAAHTLGDLLPSSSRSNDREPDARAQRHQERVSPMQTQRQPPPYAPCCPTSYSAYTFAIPISSHSIPHSHTSHTGLAYDTVPAGARRRRSGFRARANSRARARRGRGAASEGGGGGAGAGGASGSMGIDMMECWAQKMMSLHGASPSQHSDDTWGRSLRDNARHEYECEHNAERDLTRDEERVDPLAADREGDGERRDDADAARDEASLPGLGAPVDEAVGRARDVVSRARGTGGGKRRDAPFRDDLPGERHRQTRALSCGQERDGEQVGER